MKDLDEILVKLQDEVEARDMSDEVSEKRGGFCA